MHQGIQGHVQLFAGSTSRVHSTEHQNRLLRLTNMFVCHEGNTSEKHSRISDKKNRVALRDWVASR